MELKNREDLKEYFKKGCVPSEKQFAELIDSVPNILEDGQVKRTEKGWTFYPDNGKPLLFSLYPSKDTSPSWTLLLNSGNGLELKNESGETVMCIDQKLGKKPTEDKEPDDVNNIEPHIVPEKVDEPENKYSENEIADSHVFPADKNWYDVIEIASDSDSFEVFQLFAYMTENECSDMKMTVAHVYHHGVASWGIDCSRDHWWGWTGDVKFRWSMQEGKLCLQIRSKGQHIAQKLYCCIK